MSQQPKTASTKMTSFTGVFLLVFSVLVAVLDTANFFAIGISFFLMLIGIMLVMVGAMHGLQKKPDPLQLTQRFSERLSKSGASIAELSTWRRVRTVRTVERISDLCTE